MLLTENNFPRVVFLPSSSACVVFPCFMSVVHKVTWALLNLLLLRSWRSWLFKQQIVAGSCLYASLLRFGGSFLQCCLRILHSFGTLTDIRIFLHSLLRLCDVNKWKVFFTFFCSMPGIYVLFLEVTLRRFTLEILRCRCWLAYVIVKC